MGDSYRRVEAVRLAVSILRYISNHRGLVPPAEIAGALNVPYATVMCHLSTLEDEKLIRTVGGHYELDVGAALLWSRYRISGEVEVERIQKNLKQVEV